MRIPSFQVRVQNRIQLAQCDNLPNLMIIAGPNGTGKSTLLDQIRRNHGDSNRVLYIAPHRSIHKQNVQQQYLLARTISFQEILSSSNVNGMDGIALFGASRDPWGYDNSGNFLKYALCQVEIDYKDAIAARYAKQGEIIRNSVPNPWRPLQELTNNLLPHLKFEKINTTNRNQIQCLWSVHRTGQLVDFDELSSGEKSIIQMFYPLVEQNIKALIAEMKLETNETPDHVDRCVLIDEPELHLHPNLQMKVLDYLRFITSTTDTQVIIATHSPTIVEYANFEELFILRPLELVKSDENQLIRVADNDERLRLLRDLFGTTANLTSMQPIIIVEGNTEKDASRVVSDRKIYRALHPAFDRINIISGGSKSECKTLTRNLSEVLSSFSSQLQAIALLDKDYDSVVVESTFHLLPVAMIENFLIDPMCIWEVIQSVVEKTSLKSIHDVELAIDKILDEIESDEIKRRVVAKFEVVHFRPHTNLSLDQISEFAAQHAQQITERFSAENIQLAFDEAKHEIEKIKSSNRRREEYHGKAILDEFFRRYLHQTSLSKIVFKYELARRASTRKSVKMYFDRFFETVIK